jgi:hypothetical protein
LEQNYNKNYPFLCGIILVVDIGFTDLAVNLLINRYSTKASCQVEAGGFCSGKRWD